MSETLIAVCVSGWFVVGFIAGGMRNAWERREYPSLIRRIDGITNISMAAFGPAGLLAVLIGGQTYWPPSFALGPARGEELRNWPWWAGPVPRE